MPLVERTASVSVSAAVSLVRVAMSFVPVIVMVTVALPPSLVATLKVSVTTCPASSWFWAVEVAYVQAPAASMAKVP